MTTEQTDPTRAAFRDLRPEHVPTREFDGVLHKLQRIHDAWAWEHKSGSFPVRFLVVACHPDDADQSIERAMREALRKALYRVEFGVGEDVCLTRARPEVYDTLHAAYTAVFGEADDVD